MNKLQFIKSAREEKRVVYNIKKIRHKEHRGYLITYAILLNENTVTTQKEEEFWNIELKDIINQWYN